MILAKPDAVYDNILVFKLGCYGLDGWNGRK